MDENIRLALQSPSTFPYEEVVATFVELHEAFADRPWHRAEGVRDFLRRFGDENPYIPSRIGAWRAASENVRDPQPKARISKATRSIRIEDLASTINLNPAVAEQFFKNNLHDQGYFFTKFLEWHISIEHMRATDAKRIIDVGAAYSGFADVAGRAMPESEIIVSDLVFEPGFKTLSSGVIQHGADASDLSGIDNRSIDAVVLHNAFEHFEGDIDRLSLKEMKRVLKPGGTILITPMHFAQAHTLIINPFSYFLKDVNAKAKALLEEKTATSRIYFNHEMISPFARVYSQHSLRKRLKGALARLDMTLVECDFDEVGFDEDGRSEVGVFGMRPTRDLLKTKMFSYLKLTKHE